VKVPRVRAWHNNYDVNHGPKSMPARLASKVKETRGTRRPDREIKVTALNRLLASPPPPEYLSTRAKAEWVRLARVCVEIGVLTLADLRSLELLVEALAMEGELREQLAREGLTVPCGSAGNVKTHPGLRALESTRAQCLKLMDSFGLNPKSRLSVDMAPAALANPFQVHAGRDRYIAQPKPWDDSPYLKDEKPRVRKPPIA
jgi:P27 family predicted phage terminase small subunit